MRQHSVLTVDGEELALQGLEAGIDWDGLNISRLRKAHSRDEAVRLLEQEPVDIVITDIEMPDGGGLELIKWIKDNRPDIRCVFYTGHAEFSYALEALRLGVDDYLLKPMPYVPVIDGELITDDGNKLIKGGRYQHIPCILGANGDDLTAAQDERSPENNPMHAANLAYAQMVDTDAYVYYFNRKLPGTTEGIPPFGWSCPVRWPMGKIS